MRESKPDNIVWRRIKSVFAALLGVQSDANRERDFQEWKPYEFVLYGVIGAAIFVFCVWGVVKLVLSQVP